MPQSKKSTVDTISSLPDAILCHILSFVTTKEAVATSILSKRWINLWHHVLNLNFPYIKIDTIESSLLFNEFVYSVLLSRETAGSNVINDFSLNIQYENPNLAYNLGLPNITKWINSVVQRKLKYLRLHLYVHNRYDNGEDYEDGFRNLPVSIFTCRTLVSLDLHWFRVEGFSFSSNGFQFQFPSLKTLHLEYVIFSEVRDFMLLIAGCPILEDLKLSEMVLYLEEDSLKEFKTLILPKLTRADIVQFHCHGFPVNALSTSKYLCINTLQVIEHLYTEDHRVYKVNHLQCPYDGVPIFYNLTHLVLHNRWDLVVQVLHQCPKLQNLRLYKRICDSMGHEDFNQENWVEPKFVPQCLLSSLRTFTIKDFLDLQSDLMLEQYILKNARILQTMTIWCSTKQPEMERTLSVCQMASATCQISLCANI